MLDRKVRGIMERKEKGIFPILWISLGACGLEYAVSSFTELVNQPEIRTGKLDL
jgi:hypothetical protein